MRLRRYRFDPKKERETQPMRLGFGLVRQGVMVAAPAAPVTRS
jgi:hypothetical protein